jgi:DNA-directed RNA polymerase specialized sigma24 family protein
MSPLHVRRYRAERLLRDEFEGLRERVLTNVRRRLQASGVSLDQDDLGACYAQAWQGLYTATLEGQQIANPAGWLVIVTFRRAIEELRSRGRAPHDRALSAQAVSGHDRGASAETETAAVSDPDLAGQLDDRMRLQHLFEGLCGRLDGREREAATLCYLQGLSRSQAATRMGVSEARMRKLMEGRGPGQPGVAGKVGALVKSIRDGDWCEQQGSLMRALAYGMLDPQGERYQLALMHHSQCPACRAYVVSLRGLAAALPPVLLPWGLSTAVLVHVGEGAHAGGGVAGGASGSAAGGVGAAGGLQAGPTIGGAVSLSGAAGAGASSGGGWLIGAGPLTAKLATGCLLALGVGAGCVALDSGHHVSPPHHVHLAAQRPSRQASIAPMLTEAQLDALDASALTSGTRAASHAAPLTPTDRASREFGPEQALAAGSGRAAAAAAAAVRGPTARSAATRPELSASAGSTPATEAPTRDSAGAEREFSPG